MNFTLRSLLMTMPVIAVGIYALTSPSVLLFQIIFTTTVLVFLVALAVTISDDRRSRHFAAGLSIVGIGYLVVVALVGGFDPGNRPYPPLLTSWALEKLYLPLAKPSPPPPGMGMPMGMPMENYGLHEPPLRVFCNVGHTVFSWAFAVIGGALTRMLCSRFNETDIVPKNLSNENSEVQ